MTYKNNFIYFTCLLLPQKEVDPPIFNGHFCMQMNYVFIRIILAIICLIVALHWFHMHDKYRWTEGVKTELFSMTEAVLKTG